MTVKWCIKAHLVFHLNVHRFETAATSIYTIHIPTICMEPIEVQVANHSCHGNPHSKGVKFRTGSSILKTETSSTEVVSLPDPNPHAGRRVLVTAFVVMCTIM